MWPQWILKLLPSRRPVRQRLGTGKDVTYSGDFKLKGVCSTCNNGWMSELEAEVKSILGPILQDLSIQLDLEDQKKLARWAFKTAIVLEGTKERSMKRYFASGLGPALKTSGDIQGWTMIWIGRSSESGLYARAADLRYDLDGQNSSAEATVTTMVVGHVVFQVVSAVFPPEKDAELVRIPLYAEDWEQVLAKIWPPSRVFTWPPPQSIGPGDRLSLERVADRWKVLPEAQTSPLAD
ncbi:MAG: hypothetical protein JWQ49_310 [Edaphobacter sp.]|nr:hypothetical protein [Edaphobacter sp.]